MGQGLAGDDGVGFAVIERLRRIERSRVPPGVELLEAHDGAALVPWLECDAPVVLVDALLGGGGAGEIVELDGTEIAAPRARSLSTHGLHVADAIALAHIVHGSRATPRISLVGVAIHAPARGREGLSPAIAAAVPRAANAVLACLQRVA